MGIQAVSMRIRTIYGSHWAGRLFRRDPRWQSGVIAFCVLAELVCIAGYLGGYFDRDVDGELQRHAFQWDGQAIAYTAALWLIWALGLVVAAHYQRPAWIVRGTIMVSLPIVLFFALGWVQVLPR
jgi:hypothetical protein